MLAPAQRVRSRTLVEEEEEVAKVTLPVRKPPPRGLRLCGVDMLDGVLGGKGMGERLERND